MTTILGSVFEIIHSKSIPIEISHKCLPKLALNFLFKLAPVGQILCRFHKTVFLSNQLSKVLYHLHNKFLFNIVNHTQKTHTYMLPANFTFFVLLKSLYLSIILNNNFNSSIRFELPEKFLVLVSLNFFKYPLTKRVSQCLWVRSYPYKHLYFIFDQITSNSSAFASVRTCECTAIELSTHSKTQLSYTNPYFVGVSSIDNNFIALADTNYMYIYNHINNLLYEMPNSCSLNILGNAQLCFLKPPSCSQHRGVIFDYSRSFPIASRRN